MIQRRTKKKEYTQNKNNKNPNNITSTKAKCMGTYRLSATKKNPLQLEKASGILFNYCVD